MKIATCQWCPTLIIQDWKNPVIDCEMWHLWLCIHSHQQAMSVFGCNGKLLCFWAKAHFCNLNSKTWGCIEHKKCGIVVCHIARSSFDSWGFLQNDKTIRSDLQVKKVTMESSLIWLPLQFVCFLNCHPFSCRGMQDRGDNSNPLISAALNCQQHC